MSKRTKKDKRPVAKIDFKPYGAAIKAGRTKQKESRNKAADALFISPRYLANIENKGQHPSVQVFLELMSRYHISVDQILHGEAMEGKSTAVSYTHLDVYKRQLGCCPLFSMLAR